ncbi:MAG: glycosyltransferase family 39 protein [bacterium]|nr:glycosyltransferase family 39 protein [bacterium]MDT8365967.1 glycosyltransferase family 39 protein [bacterium]
MAGWILWFTRQILGDTIVAIRIPAVFTGTMVVAVIHRFTLDITRSKRSAALTGLLAMGIPVISVPGVLYSTDTPVLAAGTLGGYFFHRAVNRGDKRAWLWTGLCFAIVLGS